MPWTLPVGSTTLVSGIVAGHQAADGMGGAGEPRVALDAGQPGRASWTMNARMQRVVLVPRGLDPVRDRSRAPAGSRGRRR